MTAYAVPRELLVDYVHLLTETVPAIRSLKRKYEILLYQDSVLIAHQEREIEARDRQIGDLNEVQSLYEAEIEQRKIIEESYRREVQQLKWWRRGFAAAAIGLGTLAVVK